MKIVLILFLISLSYSQLHIVRFNSNMGVSKLIINDVDEYKIPSSINLGKGKYKFSIERSEDDFTYTFEHFVNSNVEFMVNKKLESYVKIYVPEHSFAYSDERIKGVYLNDGFKEQLVPFEGSDYKRVAINSNTKEITIHNSNFFKKAIPLDVVPFLVVEVKTELNANSLFINRTFFQLEKSRKDIVRYARYTTIATTAVFSVLAYKDYSESNDNYSKYLSAVSDKKISSNYQKYQKSRKSANSNIQISIISSAILTYLLFFDNWSDFSSEREFYNNKNSSLIIKENGFGLSFSF